MAKKTKSKPKRDETEAVLAEIIASENIKPKKSLVNKLKLFLVKRTARAKAQGIRIGIESQHES